MDFKQPLNNGIWLLLLSSLIGVLINVASNILTYQWTKNRISKENLEEIVSIIDDDLGKFIHISELIVDSYKKSGTFWYEYSAHISDSRNNLKFDKLFLLDRDLRKRFLSYYTNSQNLLSSLMAQQQEIYNINNRSELSENEKAEKKTNGYKIISDFISDLRIKKIEAENFRKDIQNTFKFLNE